MPRRSIRETGGSRVAGDVIRYDLLFGQSASVFNVAVEYLLWRAGDRVLDLRELEVGLEGRADLARLSERARAAEEICVLGDNHLDLNQRVELLYRLARHFGLDPVDLFERQRICGLLNGDELAQAARMGIDLQLHTHRHRFPQDDASIRKEIQDNRAASKAVPCESSAISVTQVVSITRRHFRRYARKASGRRQPPRPGSTMPVRNHCRCRASSTERT